MKKRALFQISTAAVMPVVLGGLFLAGGCVQEDTPMPPGVYVPRNQPVADPAGKAQNGMTEPQAITEQPVVEQPALPPVSEPVATLAVPAGKGTTYKVVKGDSLWSLSKKYNVTMEAIAESNGLTPKSKLRIGQTLTIPGSGVPVAASPKKSSKAAKAVRKNAPAKSAKSAGKKVAKASVPADGVYVVKSGDSFAKIAKRYGMKVSEIEAANPGVSSNRLKIGQKLNLKPGAVAVAAPVAVASPAAAADDAPAKTVTAPVSADDGDLEPPPTDSSAAAPAAAPATPAAAPAAAGSADPALPAVDEDDKTQATANGMEITVSEDTTVKDIITRYSADEAKFKALNPGVGPTLKKGTIVRLP